MHAASAFLSLSLPLLAAAGSLNAARATCGETADKVCFGTNGGTPQDIDLDDLQYVADYLRYIGEENSGLNSMWTMPTAVSCDEWSLPVDNAGTVLALAKHISPRVRSSVLYVDIANAIDGGPGATEAQRKAALFGCATNGGMVGVKADPANPAYNTAEYKATKAKPEGILLKIVKAV